MNGDISVSVGVMVSMLVLWAEGPQIDTRSGTFNGNHYSNGLRHIYICYLVDKVGIVGCAIHCIMHVHFPQGDEIAIGVCP